MILYFERMLPLLDRANTLFLVGVIQDDFNRLLLHVRTSPKPYFAVDNDRLVLHTEHIRPTALNNFYVRPPERSYLYYFLRGRFDTPVYRSLLAKTRDAREQYIWVRKAGNFQAVLAHRDDTFELDALKPGDLLFWASPYSVNRDPEITQTMIYLGREKSTNRRIMVGASEARVYKGQSRLGVNTFDFKVAQLSSKSRESRAPVFVGYGHIPGFRAE